MLHTVTSYFHVARVSSIKEWYGSQLLLNSINFIFRLANNFSVKYACFRAWKKIILFWNVVVQFAFVYEKFGMQDYQVHWFICFHLVGHPEQDKVLLESKSGCMWTCIM